MRWIRPVKGISKRPGVCGGQPCIDGTRMPTAILYEYVEGGWTIDDIQHEWQFSAEQIEAAIKFEQRPLQRLRRWWGRNGYRIVKNRGYGDDW